MKGTYRLVCLLILILFNFWKKEEGSLGNKEKDIIFGNIAVQQGNKEEPVLNVQQKIQQGGNLFRNKESQNEKINPEKLWKSTQVAFSSNDPYCSHVSSLSHSCQRAQSNQKVLINYTVSFLSPAELRAIHFHIRSYVTLTKTLFRNLPKITAVEKWQKIQSHVLRRQREGFSSQLGGIHKSGILSQSQMSQMTPHKTIFFFFFDCIVSSPNSYAEALSPV